MIIWAIIVLGVTCVGFYYIYKSISRVLRNDYKYCVKINEDAFKKSGFPLIKMKLKGKFCWFLLDSGANANMIFKGTGDKIFDSKTNFNIIRTDSLGGIGEETHTCIVVEEEISFNKDKFTEEFLVCNTHSAAQQVIVDSANIEVLGILGSGFFNRARWMLDLDKLVVWSKPK